MEQSSPANWEWQKAWQTVIRQCYSGANTSEGALEFINKWHQACEETCRGYPKPWIATEPKAEFWQKALERLIAERVQRTAQRHREERQRFDEAHRLRLLRRGAVTSQERVSKCTNADSQKETNGTAPALKAPPPSSDSSDSSEE